MTSNFNASVITRLQSLLTKLGGSHTMASPTNFEHEVIQILNEIDTRSSWQASSKPTTRPDGTALVTGDRYLDTSDRLTWFWNGTYWLSEQIYQAHTGYGTAVAATAGYGHHRINPSYNLYLLDFSYGGQLASPQNATDYWLIRLDRGNAAVTLTTIATIDTSSPIVSTLTGVNLTQSLNLHLDVSALGILFLRTSIIKNASAGALTQSVATTRYRLAKP